MQYQHVGYRIKGLYRLGAYALRWGMPNPKAQDRLKILRFFEKHGLHATTDAYDVSRRTLYRWKAAWEAGGGNLVTLAPQSCAPKRRRSRTWPEAVIAEIRRLRQAHPNLGKGKLYPLLHDFCEASMLSCPTESTIGRIIHDAPDRLRRTPVRLDPKGRPKTRRRVERARKPKGFAPRFPGHLIALDTVERLKDGVRRYVLTMTDVHSRFSLALGTVSHGSQAARGFLTLIRVVFPAPIAVALSDNGSEFQGMFAQSLKAEGIIHWHTYPKTPKMNAHAERFNRTVQEDFVDYHEDLLFEDMTAFNDQLADWLIWFNRDRPHYAHGQRSPLQYLIQHHPECQRWWTHTQNCRIRGVDVGYFHASPTAGQAVLASK